MLGKTIGKEKLVICFSNRVAGKDIEKSEELLRKLQITGEVYESAARYLTTDQINWSEIKAVMVDIETELNGLIERVSGCKNLESFTEEMEGLTNEINSLNDQKGKMALKLHQAAVDMEKLATDSGAPFEEFGQKIRESQRAIAKEFTKRSMACLSKISKFKVRVPNEHHHKDVLSSEGRLQN